MSFTKTTFIFMLAFSATEAKAEPFSLGEFDKQAHVLVSFEAVTTGAKILERADLPRLPAALLSSGLILTVALAKELYFDQTYDINDLWAGVVGSAFGASLILIWPDGKDTLTLDAEGGLALFSPLTNQTNQASPPFSIMIDTQTTFWVRRKIGLHFFSGGWMGADASQESTRKLLFGGGLRLPWNLEGRLSLWGGFDYGFLLFSAAPSNSFVPSAYVPMFSAGLKFKPFESRVHLGTQAMLIPYSGSWLYSAGFQGGIDL